MAEIKGLLADQPLLQTVLQTTLMRLASATSDWPAPGTCYREIDPALLPKHDREEALRWDGPVLSQPREHSLRKDSSPEVMNLRCGRVTFKPQGRPREEARNRPIGRNGEARQPVNPRRPNCPQ